MLCFWLPDFMSEVISLTFSNYSLEISAAIDAVVCNHYLQSDFYEILQIDSSKAA